MPPLSCEEGRAIAIRLGRAVAALHRAGMIHRDIKPDNVILEADGALKLIDLGVVLMPGIDDLPVDEIPGTASYMAPELRAGATGDERSDQFALGVTLFRMFTGVYPYGEVEVFSHPRFGKPASLTRLRPDLPAWLEITLQRAIAPLPADRFADVTELIGDLENGPSMTPLSPPKLSLYQRHPLMVWQFLAAFLFVCLMTMLALR
jgi:serine/threonine protein kinase